MPYIKQSDRIWYQEHIRQIVSHLCGTKPSDLNGVVTRIVAEHVRIGPRYADINAALGVLKCAKLDLRRRVAAPYEGAKCEQNGDVY